MDSKYKRLLQQHRPFLVRNIIWSTQLADLLKAQGLITEFMIKDIESCSKREDKIQRLIDVIPLRGNHAYIKFTDVLQLTGHVFIADFLREDDDNQKLFDIKDMYKQLPFVQKAFNETERKLIENYMSEKMESQVLKLLWKRDNREKDKALEAKQKQIEQSYEYEDLLKAQFEAKANTIAMLEKEINASVEDKQELKAKLAALSRAHREMEDKHKENLAVQMRYNTANDSAVERAKEKIATLEAVLNSIQAKVKNIAKPLIQTQITSSNRRGSNTDETNSEKKEIKSIQNQYGFLIEDIDNVINRYNHLCEVKMQYEKLLEERDYILIHFGFNKNTEPQHKNGGLSSGQDQEPSLVRAYKEFAVKNDENIMKMKKEIEKYDGLLEENKAKLDDLAREKDDTSKKFALGTSAWQSAIMNVMRKQLQDLKSDVRKKETMMSMQDEEMTKLKHKVLALEQQLNSQEQMSLCPKDTLDGRVSAASPDSVELIPSETPVRLTKSRNLPPLKSSKSPKVVSSSPRATVTRSKPINNFIVKAPLEASSNNYITFPMGPITTPMRPETRPKNSVMGSVLGDLKAMNKHHTKSMMDETRSSYKRGSNSLIK